MVTMHVFFMCNVRSVPANAGTGQETVKAMELEMHINSSCRSVLQA